MGGVGDSDRQPQLGGGGLEVLEEAGEGCDPAVESFGRSALSDQVVAPSVDDGDAGPQQGRRIAGPGDLAEGD
jgi:hypothetical protein